MRLTFDTNILIYAADSSAAHKHSLAIDLTDRAAGADCVIMLQSLGEFYNVATRKIGLDPKVAEGHVDDWRSTFPVYPASERSLAGAMEAVRRHRLSFWGAMLWAAAREAGCRVLLSEDFQDGGEIGGVRFVDPFLAANDGLLDLALPNENSI